MGYQIGRSLRQVSHARLARQSHGRTVLETGRRQHSDKELWDVHNLQKENLVRFTRNRERAHLARHGASPDDLRGVEELLDPQALTIGFARRFATYKRADLLFRNFDRLRAILKDPEPPGADLFAGQGASRGQARPGIDPPDLRHLPKHGLHGHIIFIENHNIRVARMLVQGVDVWLNNPRRPHEASGTSGMKAPVNGGINFSIADGWWCEVQIRIAGWTIGKPEETPTPTRRTMRTVSPFTISSKIRLSRCIMNATPTTCRSVGSST